MADENYTKYFNGYSDLTVDQLLALDEGEFRVVMYGINRATRKVLADNARALNGLKKAVNIHLHCPLIEKKDEIDDALVEHRVDKRFVDRSRGRRLAISGAIVAVLTIVLNFGRILEMLHKLIEFLARGAIT